MNSWKTKALLLIALAWPANATDLNDWVDLQSVIQTAAVSATGTDTTVVAAAGTGMRVVVVQVALCADDSSIFSFEDGTNGTPLTGAMPLFAGEVLVIGGNANGCVIFPFSPAGWFATSANTLLNLTRSGGDVFGVIGYIVSE